MLEKGSAKTYMGLCNALIATRQDHIVSCYFPKLELGSAPAKESATVQDKGIHQCEETSTKDEVEQIEDIHVKGWLLVMVYHSLKRRKVINLMFFIFNWIVYFNILKNT